MSVEKSLIIDLASAESEVFANIGDYPYLINLRGPQVLELSRTEYPVKSEKALLILLEEKLSRVEQLTLTGQIVRANLLRVTDITPNKSNEVERLTKKMIVLRSENLYLVKIIELAITDI